MSQWYFLSFCFWLIFIQTQKLQRLYSSHVVSPTSPQTKKSLGLIPRDTSDLRKKLLISEVDTGLYKLQKKGKRTFRFLFNITQEKRQEGLYQETGI